MELRDKIRSATLGQKVQFKKQKIKYGEIEVEIRQPSIADRSELQELCSEKVYDGPNNDPVVKFDHLKFFVWTVIQHTYVPGTNEKVFENSDFDAMCKCPSGSFMDKFFEAASELSNIKPEALKNG